MKLWEFQEFVKTCNKIGIYTFGDLESLRVKTFSNTNDELIQVVNRRYIRKFVIHN